MQMNCDFRVHVFINSLTTLINNICQVLWFCLRVQIVEAEGPETSCSVGDRET